MTPRVLSSFLVILTLIIVAVLCSKKLPFLGYGILWFFITLIPTSSVVPSTIIVAEHRLYLPLIGLSFSFIEIIKRIEKQLFKLIFILPAIVILGILTVKRNYVWQSDYSLWKDALIKSPKKDRPYLGTGRYLS